MEEVFNETIWGNWEEEKKTSHVLIHRLRSVEGDNWVTVMHTCQSHNYQCSEGSGWWCR
jgi:hypothetical protein